MRSFNFRRLGNYPNNGQDIEQSIRKALTGETVKADNLAHDKGTDCLCYQIKSARATVCKGLDLDDYLNRDKATAYIYGTLDGTAYIMSRNEWQAFCEHFAKPTYESKKNGGGAKLRLGHETKAILEYLSALN